MRLIDADALELYLCMEEIPQGPEGFLIRKYCFPCRQIFEAIKEQPTIEVQDKFIVCGEDVRGEENEAN